MGTIAAMAFGPRTKVAIATHAALYRHRTLQGALRHSRLDESFSFFRSKGQLLVSTGLVCRQQSSPQENQGEGDVQRSAYDFPCS